jgi:hypothetical protein
LCRLTLHTERGNEKNSPSQNDGVIQKSTFFTKNVKLGQSGSLVINIYIYIYNAAPKHSGKHKGRKHDFVSVQLTDIDFFYLPSDIPTSAGIQAKTTDEPSK